MTSDAHNTGVREGEPPDIRGRSAVPEGEPTFLPVRHLDIRWLVLGFLVILWAVISWLLVGSPLPAPLRPPAMENVKVNERVDPALQEKFKNIKEGMRLEEVEAIMGPAGLSYSSQIEREYYIWKSNKGWIRVWVEQNKVTAKQFDPHLTSVD